MSNYFTFLHPQNFVQIIKVSPKGQITIPKKLRDLCKTGSFALDISGKTIFLRPIEIKISTDETENFAALADESFNFWGNEADDVYQNFYKNK